MGSGLLFSFKLKLLPTSNWLSCFDTKPNMTTASSNGTHLMLAGNLQSIGMNIQIVLFNVSSGSWLLILKVRYLCTKLPLQPKNAALVF